MAKPKLFRAKPYEPVIGDMVVWTAGRGRNRRLNRNEGDAGENVGSVVEIHGERITVEDSQGKRFSVVTRCAVPVPTLEEI